MISTKFTVLKISMGAILTITQRVSYQKTMMTTHYHLGFRIILQK